MATSEELREQGNSSFRSGDYLQAAAAYTRALRVTPSSAVLYSNRSLALLKLNKLNKALADAEECTRLDPSNVKGWYRRAQVLEAQGYVDRAIDVLKAGSEATAGAGDKELAQQIKALGRKLRDQGTDSGAGTVKAPLGRVAENGGRAPKSPAEAEALAFADAWLCYASEQLQEHGTDFSPTVHFLAGTSNTPAQPQPEASVQGTRAFSDPATLGEFVNYLRQKSSELSARAVVSIVPKAQVAFPQMWTHQLWPYSREQDGVFVQLQAALIPTGDDPHNKATAAGGGAKAKKQHKDAGGAAADQGRGGNMQAASTQLTKLWFVRLAGRLDGAFKVRTPHELPQELALLPSLIK